MKSRQKNRKIEHIQLTKDSQIGEASIEERFNYEPIFGVHPTDDDSLNIEFLGKKLNAPLWISSMTGGTDNAEKINKNLALAAKEFGLGMGLGSCRSLLHDDLCIKDFDVRNIIGNDLPFYANLGVFQVEQLVRKKQLFKIHNLIEKLKVDGLIVHINPLQEWFQVEGDRFVRPPIETIAELLELVSFPVIIKEVGQGMGPKSLNALVQMPLAAIEFGAFGGTNFSKLEVLRRDSEDFCSTHELIRVGHTAIEMVNIINHLLSELGSDMRCRQYIISGGIKTFMDGYYLKEKLIPRSIVGQANKFLDPAADCYESLKKVIQDELNSLKMAQNFLELK
ncbi:MAG: type 2 isopentenyl-diphosphate Delta-isomerase [Methylococcales bacterium]|jgi:isopentenyl-diphosphate Delta-isomerase|nr:type 2 isopentenyl-diphosphate Delta-isomerase [Methylococcales bacterium]MBT7411324.1 type 2 isopentenyl-diphosphate Delta-isomerase [Methylococcales bacterium]